jgi:protein tyrosine/serine phosphatase
VLVTVLFASSSAMAQHKEHVAVKAPRVSIDNFGRVNDNYFRGAQPETKDYQALASLGVKTVINLIGSDADPAEKAMVARHGMEYLHIPMNTHVPPTQQQLATFLQTVNDPARQPVFVHCVGGKHRTGVMTAVYRMTRDGWTAEQAFKEMKQFKFGADFLHPEFKRYVYGFRPELVAGAGGTPIATETR